MLNVEVITSTGSDSASAITFGTALTNGIIALGEGKDRVTLGAFVNNVTMNGAKPSSAGARQTR